MKLRFPESRFWFVGVTVLGFSRSAATLADHIPIYGGPAYDPVGGDGFQNYTVPRQKLGVNLNGVAIGTATKLSNNTSAGTRAVRWDVNGPATELSNLGIDSAGMTNVSTFGINARGTTVGYANLYNNGTLLYARAVRWDAGSAGATQLGELSTNPYGISFAYGAINSTGVIVGNAEQYNGHSYSQGSRAVRWDAGSTAAVQLGDLGTRSSGSARPAAGALNDSGTIVGYAHKYSGAIDSGPRAVRWPTGSTAAIELGNLGTTVSGYTESVAIGINAFGTSFGSANKYAVVQTSEGTSQFRRAPDPCDGTRAARPPPSWVTSARMHRV